MDLSRTLLVKGGRKVILQGMIHIGPQELYATLQSQVDQAVKNDYLVLFEGVKGNTHEKEFEGNAQKIDRFFTLILNLYPIFAEIFGISLQKERIKYPDDAVNADITYREFIERLNRNNFKCDLLLWMFSHKDIQEKLREKSSEENFSMFLKKAEKKSFASVLAWIAFRKASPIVLDYRNKIAFETIKYHSVDQNIFVHYGEKHMKGLIKLLRKDGWKVKTITHIPI